MVSRSTFEKYDAKEIPLPKNLNDDLSDRPNIYQHQGLISTEISDDEWRMARTCYHGRVTELDTEFGHLVEHLEISGELENTIVIVTADHGRYADAHNFGLFEEIYRIPMIISGPGIVAGVETSGLVGLHDICPTILELTGNTSFDVPDSKSLVPLL